MEGAENLESPHTRTKPSGRSMARPEIWLLFARGYSAAELVHAGFSRSTVYSARSRWPSVQIAFADALKKLKAGRAGHDDQR